ncbi:hypothetical protein DPMN_126632 [Dreissena polymorpha]|uniref:Uncharacterized protein n=1 Tax=Dreissena polymorpha TaxID=45954 RepID=A0A9D4JVS1_DREPO|nr:hypothetical protein DPMN_126632 [Dreissena polymorpha]
MMLHDDDEEEEDEEEKENYDDDDDDDDDDTLKCVDIDNPFARNYQRRFRRGRCRTFF